MKAGFCCPRAECAGRESVVELKDHDGTLIETLTARGGFTCPVCGEPAVVQWVHTALQADRDFEFEARESVNLQMWIRDHYEPGFPPAVTLDLAGDDRLPPTPPGWWETRDPSWRPSPHLKTLIACVDMLAHLAHDPATDRETREWFAQQRDRLLPVIRRTEDRERADHA